jgi:hypothetical protein
MVDYQNVSKEEAIQNLLEGAKAISSRGKMDRRRDEGYSYSQMLAMLAFVFERAFLPAEIRVLLSLSPRESGFLSWKLLRGDAEFEIHGLYFDSFTRFDNIGRCAGYCIWQMPLILDSIREAEKYFAQP